MLTSVQCRKKWGEPAPENEPNYMTLWIVPGYIVEAFQNTRFSALGTIGFPKKIYCNKALVTPLRQALDNVITRQLTNQLKTWDGCFVVRKKRGQSSPSLHSWGAAIDINAYDNAFGKKPQMPQALVKCFTDAGLEWGGTWSKPDGMHFQLKTI